MPATLRLLQPSDLGFAHGLSRDTGWNQTRRDWERFLSLAPDGCFLAEVDGQPAGTATTTAYGTGLAWIGMVLVHPAFRRRGVGTLLLNGAIHHLREEKGIACVGLDATPEGRPLYEGLGFRADWQLRRWMRSNGAMSGSGTREPVTLTDAHFTIDRAVFGADRSALLRSLAAGSSQGRIAEDGSFGFFREGERATYLGPVSAAAPESGVAIARELVAATPSGRPVFWDLADSNTMAASLARELGFEPVRVLTRMWLGEAVPASDPLRMFGIAEPGLG